MHGSEKRLEYRLDTLKYRGGFTELELAVRPGSYASSAYRYYFLDGYRLQLLP